MIYALWYKFKGPDAPWIARDFSEDRTRGQFIARHKKGLSEWAIDTTEGDPSSGFTSADIPPPCNITIHRNP